MGKVWWNERVWSNMSVRELHEARARRVRIAAVTCPSDRERQLAEIVEIDEELRFLRSIGVNINI
jgi:hypothetical protein